MKEQEPLLPHHIYPSLQNKRLLIIETYYTGRQILEEAKSMQNMKAVLEPSKPRLHGQCVSLATYMQEKNLQLLVIHPYDQIIPDIDEVITKGHTVALIHNDQSVNQRAIQQIEAWKQQGVPVVLQHPLSDLPERVMSVLATMINQE